MLNKDLTANHIWSKIRLNFFLYLLSHDKRNALKMHF